MCLYASLYLHLKFHYGQSYNFYFLIQHELINHAASEIHRQLQISRLIQHKQINMCSQQRLFRHVICPVCANNNNSDQNGLRVDLSSLETRHYVCFVNTFSFPRFTMNWPCYHQAALDSYQCMPTNVLRPASCYRYRTRQCTSVFPLTKISQVTAIKTILDMWNAEAERLKQLPGHHCISTKMDHCCPRVSYLFLHNI